VSLQKIDPYGNSQYSKMEWYGKKHLNPTYTKKLVKKWQSPPGNTAAYYYSLFPDIYPKHLPDDHYIVKYNEALYPTHRDYSTFRSAPKNASADYYARLEAWRENGTPM